MELVQLIQKSEIQNLLKLLLSIKLKITKYE